MHAFVWSPKLYTPLLRIASLNVKRPLHVARTPHIDVKVWSKQFATDRTYLQPEQLSLLPGQVDIWWLRPEEVQDVNLTNQYMQLLSPAEQQYVSEASSNQTAKERLLARTLQRTVLARYCSDCIAPPALHFERNRHGKPHLSWEESQGQPDPPIHFSLTHTQSLLGIAVSCGTPVGLDVEVADRHTRTDVLKLAKRRFAPAELASLEGIHDSNERTRRFVQTWNLKEAYVKALGQGISAAPGLKGFSVVMKRGNSAETTTEHEAASPILDTACQIHFAAEHDLYNFQPIFMLFTPFDEHIAALCMQQQSAGGEPFGRQQSTDSNVSVSAVFDGNVIRSDSELAHGSDSAVDSSHSICPAVRFIQTIPLVYEQLCSCKIVACSAALQL